MVTVAAGPSARGGSTPEDQTPARNCVKIPAAAPGQDWMCLFLVLLCVQGKQLNKAEAEPGALLPHSSTAMLIPCGDFI